MAKNFRPGKNTIAFRAILLLQRKKGLTAEEIAKTLRAEFKSATTTHSVAWYASKARRSGVKVNLKSGRAA